MEHKRFAATLFIAAGAIALTIAVLTKAEPDTCSSNTAVAGYYSGVCDSYNFAKSLKKLISKHDYIPNKKTWEYLESSHESTSNANQVTLFYTRRNIPKNQKASGGNQANNDFWNREHVWPQSHGLKGNKSRRDLHNIVPADRSVNISRGNKYFDDGGVNHDECSECMVDLDSWEPPNEVKGDVARILFYMDFRYGRTLNLSWTDRDALFRWHCSDQVSARELKKNAITHAFQGNRNPFIDFPDWVSFIYDVDC